MLEKLLRQLGSSFGLVDIKKAILAVSLATLGTACQSFCRPSRYALTQDERTELSVILNDPGVDHDKYLGAINLWPGDREIWPELHTREARIKFTKMVVDKDLIDHEKYFYDDSKDQSYKPCDVTKFSGDTDPKYQECLESRTESIDETNPMTCRHFTRKFMWVYGKQGKPSPTAPSHVRYNLPYVENKLSLPLREMEIVRPTKITVNPSGEESREQVRPHAVIGVWLANQPMKVTSSSQFNAVDNWYIFDPQNDRQLLVPPHNLELTPGNVFLIYPEHNLPLDSETKRPVNVAGNLDYNSVLAFAINKDQQIIPAHFLGSRATTQLIYEQAAYGKNFARIMDRFQEAIVTKGLPQKIIATMNQSNNFTDLELKSVNDWYYVLSHPDLLTLSVGSYNYIKGFLSSREDYFQRPSTSLNCWDDELNVAFNFLNNLGLLRPSEIVYSRQFCSNE